MKCDHCKKETQWLEIIGQQFICKKCIEKHKILGNLHRTHTNTFNWLIKKLKLVNYEDMMAVSRSKIEEHVDLKSLGIKLRTTNIVEIE
jgi:hypothetical protein